MSDEQQTCHSCGSENGLHFEWCTVPLRSILAPVMDWYQPDDQHARPLADILRDIVADLQDDRASLLRIEQALPRTADGVPIVPEMTVYCIVGGHVDERRVIGPYGKVALLTHEPGGHGTCPGSTHRLANTVYAAREVALESVKKSLA
jgi:hypothetical protein